MAVMMLIKGIWKTEMPFGLGDDRVRRQTTDAVVQARWICEGHECELVFLVSSIFSADEILARLDIYRFYNPSKSFGAHEHQREKTSQGHFLVAHTDKGHFLK